MTINFSEIFTYETLQLAIAGAIVYLGVLWIVLIAWVTKDIVNRSNNLLLQTISVLLVIILNIFGLLIYLAIRPQKTLKEKMLEELELEMLMEATQGKTKKEKRPGKRLTTKKLKKR